MAELSHKQKLAILLSGENGDHQHFDYPPTSSRLPKTPKFKKIKLKLESIKLKDLRLKKPKLKLKKNKSKLYV